MLRCHNLAVRAAHEPVGQLVDTTSTLYIRHALFVREVSSNPARGGLRARSGSRVHLVLSCACFWPWATFETKSSADARPERLEGVPQCAALPRPYSWREDARGGLACRRGKRIGGRWRQSRSTLTFQKTPNGSDNASSYHLSCAQPRWWAFYRTRIADMTTRAYRSIGFRHC